MNKRDLQQNQQRKKPILHLNNNTIKRLRNHNLREEGRADREEEIVTAPCAGKPKQLV